MINRTTSPSEINTVFDKKIPNVGDTVTFGSYYQSGASKEPIAWRVLEIKGKRALIISNLLLDAKPYNIKYKDITWEGSTIRKWLNRDFMLNAFTLSERRRIRSARVKTANNTRYYTKGGRVTKDKLFLLSLDEAEKYFSFNSERICLTTAYAISKVIPSDSGKWWLRSPGYKQHQAAYVGEEGRIADSGALVDEAACYVRPALWIKF